MMLLILDRLGRGGCRFRDDNGPAVSFRKEARIFPVACRSFSLGLNELAQQSLRRLVLASEEPLGQAPCCVVLRSERAQLRSEC